MKLYSLERGYSETTSQPTKEVRKGLKPILFPG